MTPYAFGPLSPVSTDSSVLAVTNGTNVTISTSIDGVKNIRYIIYMSTPMNFMSPTTRPATEIMNVRLLEGTSARIDKVLKGGEIRAMFIRAAIEAELKRRERD